MHTEQQDGRFRVSVYRPLTGMDIGQYWHHSTTHVIKSQKERHDLYTPAVRVHGDNNV